MNADEPKYWKRRNDDEMFDKSDFVLLTEALSLFPDLEAAAKLVKTVDPQLTYPVDSSSDLREALQKGKCRLRCRSRAWTSKDIATYLKPCFFPIQDRSDLLRKVLMALSIGGKVHYHERQLRALLTQEEPASHIPITYPATNQDEYHE